jgi:hypothetical protein
MIWRSTRLVFQGHRSPLFHGQSGPAPWSRCPTGLYDFFAMAPSISQIGKIRQKIMFEGNTIPSCFSWRDRSYDESGRLLFPCLERLLLFCHEKNHATVVHDFLSGVLK